MSIRTQKVYAAILLGIGIFAYPAYSNAQTNPTGNCRVVGATFLNSTIVNKQFIEAKPGTVDIQITTMDCVGTPIGVVMKEVDMVADNNVQAFITQTNNAYTVTVPEGNNTAVIKTQLSEDACETQNGAIPDCSYYIETVTKGVRFRSSQDPSATLAYLNYKCDGACNKATAQILGVSYKNSTLSNETVQKNTPITGSGECWDSKEKRYKPNCYELLSGIPITDADGNPIKKIELELGDKQWSFGDLVNAFFGFGIGLAGVLAVIMIIYYSWQYLTTTNMNWKVLLKDKIGKVLLGLLLLLGTYTILKTINPDLLRVDLFVEKLPGKQVEEGEYNPYTRKMRPVGEGGADIFSSVTAESTSTNGVDVSFIVRAILKPGVEPIPGGLKIVLGLNADNLTKEYSMTLGSDGQTYFLERTEGTDIDKTWYFKIVKSENGEQVAIPETKGGGYAGGDIGDDEIDKIIEEVAEKQDIDVCLLKTLVEHESTGNSRAVGHDENAYSSIAASVPSRRAFLKSGDHYSGQSFTPSQSYTTKFDNDDASIDETDPGLGLDWRFSHGIGLMQVTFFPKNYTSRLDYTAKSSDKRNIPTLSIGGQSYTPRDMLDPVKNITVGALRFKQLSDGDFCGENFNLAFRAYNGGSCSTTNRGAIEYGENRLEDYMTCKDALATADTTQGNNQKIKVRNASGQEVEFSPNTKCPGESAPANATCVKIPTNITQKYPGYFAERSLVQNLVSMNQRLSQQGIPWRVTEPWPPTEAGLHRNSCHTDGTCVDIGFNPPNPNASARHIISVIQSASASGMCAEYEVPNASLRAQYIQDGVPERNIKAVSYITAPHFSLYNEICS